MNNEFLASEMPQVRALCTKILFKIDLIGREVKAFHTESQPKPY